MDRKETKKLNDLTQLKLVQVHKFPPELRTLAQEEGLTFGGWLCDSNSLKLVRLVMDRLPDHPCSLVAGFALPPIREPSGALISDPEIPRAHVWVRFDGCDYDPSWEQKGWPVETILHYEAFSILPADLPCAPAPNSGALRRLSRLAQTLEIDIC